LSSSSSSSSSFTTFGRKNSLAVPRAMVAGAVKGVQAAPTVRPLTTAGFVGSALCANKA
jgi:hypothetical protein